MKIELKIKETMDSNDQKYFNTIRSNSQNKEHYCEFHGSDSKPLSSTFHYNQFSNRNERYNKD